MTSTKLTVPTKNRMRLIGLLYLLVIICAGFSQGYVRGTIVVTGDTAATAQNIIEQMALFRFGIASDIVAFLLDAVISVMLYIVFRPYGKTLALVSAALRLLAHPAIASLNLLNHYMAYHVLDGGLGIGFTPAQLEALSLFFMDAHRFGYLIAGVFFGAHLFLLGLQIYSSPIIPKVFGGFLIGSAAGYLLESFGNFGFPGNESWLALLVGVSAAIGEVGLTFYLLLKGRRNTV
jgi:hypothetical protein